MSQCTIPPLNQRVFRSGHSSNKLLHQGTLQRPLKFKQWCTESMDKAINAVLNEGMSIRRAAEHYGVPKSTLGDRISGRVLPGSTSGPSRILNDEEEEELVIFLRRCASVGFSKSRKELLALVQAIAEQKGTQHLVTEGWWNSFIKRHPDVTLRAPVPLSQARARATDEEVMDHYFDLLEATFQQYNLLGKPGQIFNLDESGFPLNPKPPKGVFDKGIKNPTAYCTGDKAQITVLACVNAIGNSLPPMVIFDRQTFPIELATGEIPGTIYGFSQSGWIDQDLFDKWFDNHFLHYAPAARPILLLMDGHSSHYHPGTIRKAAENKVVLFVLPPNTTHLTQPLDKGCFGPLKAKWSEVCHGYMAKNPGKVVNRFVFCQLLHEAWTGAMTSLNIKAGFRTTGIYPLDRNAVAVKVRKPIAATDISKTGLPFIPLCSPLPQAKGLEVSTKLPAFTQEQLQRFEKRFEAESEPDEEYKRWMDLYHPQTSRKPPIESNTAPSLVSFSIPASTSVLQKQLSEAASTSLPKTRPKIKAAAYGRVLTSAENLKIIEEQQKEKELKKNQKQKGKKSPNEDIAMDTCTASSKTPNLLGMKYA